MNAFTSISADAVPDALSRHAIRALPVVVIFPHNQCNCRCVMCDIWRIRQAREITPDDLRQHLSSFRELGVRWVVFSGGEPQMNERWSCLAQILRQEGIRVTLLTAGLLLKSQAQAVAQNVDDVIVSLDGPAAIHNRVRRVPRAFEQLAEGISALRSYRSDIGVRARCTVQKDNHRSLCATVRAAKEIELNSISFLAADLTSSAFNRPEGWPSDRQERVALNGEEIDALQTEVQQLIAHHGADLDSGFIVENREKLTRIVRHFRAHIGQDVEVAPHCNAPWVSAVIEASGDVRPCFFHPVYGNLRSRRLADVLNAPEALHFRANLDIEANPVCRKCVCSLHISKSD